jgi:hypothetical protein
MTTHYAAQPALRVTVISEMVAAVAIVAVAVAVAQRLVMARLYES